MQVQLDVIIVELSWAIIDTRRNRVNSQDLSHGLVALRKYQKIAHKNFFIDRPTFCNNIFDEFSKFEPIHMFDEIRIQLNFIFVRSDEFWVGAKNLFSKIQTGQMLSNVCTVEWRIEKEKLWNFNLISKIVSDEKKHIYRLLTNQSKSWLSQSLILSHLVEWRRLETRNWKF